MSDSTYGKYRLIAELGHGGMADVFLAVIAGPVGSGFSKLTVIKRLRANLAEEPEFVAMLVDEARIAARLNHPNVVQTNEVGQVGSQYFMAMEYLDGQPLHRIQHRSRQSEERAAAAGTRPDEASTLTREMQYVVLLDSLAGLHHAHELADYDGTPLQIVHRDVSPHNIFVTYEGQVKVVDFGIAKAVGRSSETQHGIVKGKVRFMAPEQAIGQSVDRRADLFAVGIMLWEIAVGRRLWKDMDDMQIVQALVAGDYPASPRAVQPSVPEGIDAICRKALAPHPQDRYATADEMRTALEQYLAETGKLVDARRKLGSVVGELFKDKRAEIRGVIEKQLAVLKTRPNIDFAPVEIPTDTMSGAGQLSMASGPMSLTPSGSSSSGLHSSAGPNTNTGQSQSQSVSQVLTGPEKRNNAIMAGAAGAAAAIVVAVVVLAVARNKNVDPVPSSSAAPLEAKKDVVVKLTASPPTAVVKIDGVHVSSPYEARVPRDSRDHVVTVEAPGFEPQTQTVQYTSDLTLVFGLVKRVPTVQTSARAAPPVNWTAKKPYVPPAAHAPPTKNTPEPQTTPTPPPAVTSQPPAKKPAETIDKGDPWRG